MGSMGYDCHAIRALIPSFTHFKPNMKIYEVHMKIHTTIINHQSKWKSENKSPSIINHHQPSSTIINHHQPSSTIINHHQPSSTIINHHQPSSTIINHHQPSSTIINHKSEKISHPPFPLRLLISIAIPSITHRGPVPTFWWGHNAIERSLMFPWSFHIFSYNFQVGTNSSFFGVAKKKRKESRMLNKEVNKQNHQLT